MRAVDITPITQLYAISHHGGLVRPGVVVTTAVYQAVRTYPPGGSPVVTGYVPAHPRRRFGDVGMPVIVFDEAWQVADRHAPDRTELGRRHTLATAFARPARDTLAAGGVPRMPTLPDEGPRSAAMWLLLVTDGRAVLGPWDDYVIRRDAERAERDARRAEQQEAARVQAQADDEARRAEIDALHRLSHVLGPVGPLLPTTWRDVESLCHAYASLAEHRHPDPEAHYSDHLREAAVWRVRDGVDGVKVQAHLHDGVEIITDTGVNGVIACRFDGFTVEDAERLGRVLLAAAAAHRRMVAEANASADLDEAAAEKGGR